MRCYLNFRSVLTCLAAFTLVLTACSSGGPSSDSVGNIKVVATTTQIGDFARNVGGDHIDLTVLLSPNQDAHDFELEPSQIRAIGDADLVLRNGLGLDSFLDKALEGSSATLATLSDGVLVHEGGQVNEDHAGEDQHAVDPHIWFAVDNAKLMVENLRDALTAADPANAKGYRDRAGEYLRQLEALDGEIRSAVAPVPEECRKLVTNHDVLGYFADAYGFQVLGSVIPNTSSDAQPSAADVAEIIASVKSANIPAIFAEASINPALMQQVEREAGVELVDDLYGDSLGPEGSDGETYIEMMRANTQKITGALKSC